jgi:hypothetical protein
MTVANPYADPENDTLQAGVSDFIRFFRRHAPAILRDEIRARITSTIDLGLGFQEGYLLDLILQEAVTRVVQTLTTDHSRRYEAATRGNAEAGLRKSNNDGVVKELIRWKSATSPKYRRARSKL